MKAKTGGAGSELTRYEPVVGEDYPEVVEQGGVTYYRLWCRPFFIVYEKIKNNVILGYYILPMQKDIFTFNGVVNYAEQITAGEVLCKPALHKPSSQKPESMFKVQKRKRARG